MKKRKGKGIVLTAIWIIFLIPVCSIVLEIGRQDRITEIDNRNPFQLKAITVTNRGSSYLGYEAYDRNTLYEVRLTLENVGASTGRSKSFMEFEWLMKDGSKRSAFESYYDGGSEFRHEDRSSIVIPSGMTGDFVYYLEANEYMNQLRIEEKEKTLKGKKQSWTVSLTGERQGPVVYRYTEE